MTNNIILLQRNRTREYVSENTDNRQDCGSHLISTVGHTLDFWHQKSRGWTKWKEVGHGHVQYTAEFGAIFRLWDT